MHQLIIIVLVVLMDIIWIRQLQYIHVKNVLKLVANVQVRLIVLDVQMIIIIMVQLAFHFLDVLVVLLVKLHV